MLEGIGEERVHFAMQEKSKPQMLPGIWCFLLAKKNLSFENIFWLFSVMEAILYKTFCLKKEKIGLKYLDGALPQFRLNCCIVMISTEVTQSQRI